MFESFEEGIEVNGTTILAIAEAIRTVKFLADRYFTQVGLPTREELEFRKKEWFSQQKWLDAFKLVSENIGTFTLFKIGKLIPENAIFPPDIDSIEKALNSIDIAYHMNHRNSKGEVLFDESRGEENIMLEGIGHYGYEKVEGENKAILECKNPYPCDFDRGIITTMAHRFRDSAEITHDDSKPCRKDGANSCTYIVTWT